MGAGNSQVFGLRSAAADTIRSRYTPAAQAAPRSEDDLFHGYMGTLLGTLDLEKPGALDNAVKAARVMARGGKPDPDQPVLDYRGQPYNPQVPLPTVARTDPNRWAGIQAARAGQQTAIANQQARDAQTGEMRTNGTLPEGRIYNYNGTGMTVTESQFAEARARGQNPLAGAGQPTAPAANPMPSAQAGNPGAMPDNSPRLPLPTPTMDSPPEVVRPFSGPAVSNAGPQTPSAGVVVRNAHQGTGYQVVDPKKSWEGVQPYAVPGAGTSTGTLPMRGPNVDELGQVDAEIAAHKQQESQAKNRSVQAGAGFGGGMASVNIPNPQGAAQWEQRMGELQSRRDNIVGARSMGQHGYPGPQGAVGQPGQAGAVNEQASRMGLGGQTFTPPPSGVGATVQGVRWANESPALLQHKARIEAGIERAKQDQANAGNNLDAGVKAYKAQRQLENALDTVHSKLNDLMPDAKALGQEQATAQTQNVANAAPGSAWNKATSDLIAGTRARIQARQTAQAQPADLSGISLPQRAPKLDAAQVAAATLKWKQDVEAGKLPPLPAGIEKAGEALIKGAMVPVDPNSDKTGAAMPGFASQAMHDHYVAGIQRLAQEHPEHFKGVAEAFGAQGEKPALGTNAATAAPKGGGTDYSNVSDDSLLTMFRGNRNDPTIRAEVARRAAAQKGARGDAGAPGQPGTRGIPDGGFAIVNPQASLSVRG
jgi:hypothetical protein